MRRGVVRTSVAVAELDGGVLYKVRDMVELEELDEEEQIALLQEYEIAQRLCARILEMIDVDLRP